MTDYTHDVGSTGKLMIRDTGTTVEFFLNSNNGTTSVPALPFGWTVNGSTGSSTFDYNPGAGWQRVKSSPVAYSQEVTFRLGKTNTSAFGGPSTFSHSIFRATVPDPPHSLVASSITPTSAHLVFSDGDDGGAAIDARQIGYGTSLTAPTTYVNYSGGVTITTLKPGTVYRVWARTHNVKGWSPLSARGTVSTPPAARVKVGSVWKNALPYVRVGGVWKQVVPWVRVEGAWKETI